MRLILPMAMLYAWFCGIFTTGFTQSTSNAHQDSITHLLRIFEDNYFIKIWGKGTDDAYTNGTLPRAGSFALQTIKI